MSETKTCSKCGKTYPATTEYFARNKLCRDGLRPECKACEHEYRKANRERIREKNREYRADNAERISAQRREYRAANAERLREENRQYRAANRERYREYYAANAVRIREKDRRYRATNRERLREKDREYRAANAERLREKNRRYSATNLERMRIHNHNRSARKLGLRDDFTLEQHAFALDYFGNVCAVCGRPFYDLFGERRLALDHWIPLSSPDCPGTTAVNLVPLCHGIDGCNNRKKNRDPEEWLVLQFGKRKAREILQRIEAYFDAVRERFSDDDVA